VPEGGGEKKRSPLGALVLPVLHSPSSSPRSVNTCRCRASHRGDRVLVRPNIDASQRRARQPSQSALRLKRRPTWLSGIVKLAGRLPLREVRLSSVGGARSSSANMPATSQEHQKQTRFFSSPSLPLFRQTALPATRARPRPRWASVPRLARGRAPLRCRRHGTIVTPFGPGGFAVPPLVGCLRILRRIATEAQRPWLPRMVACACRGAGDDVAAELNRGLPVQRPEPLNVP